jgi:DNA modification methylase
VNLLRSKSVLVGPRDLSGRPTWEVAIGDALTRLREIPSRSVDSCVTSPAYWGLRDYGTATWQGGSAGCPHAEIRRTTSAEFSARWGTTRGESASVPMMPIRGPVCTKCGAVRLRDQQMGSEPTLAEWARAHVVVFEEVKRVLKDHGTLWLNIGDAYAGSRAGGTNYATSTINQSQKKMQAASKTAKRNARAAGATAGPGIKPKDLLLMPERLALALRDAGWWVRGRNIWAKTSYLPESVTDRAVKSHEHVWLLSKSARYYYDTDAVRTDHADTSPGFRSERLPGASPDSGRDKVFATAFHQRERLNDPRGANLRDVWNLDPEKTHADHGEPHDDELASIDEEIAALEHGIEDATESMANARRDLDRFFDSTVVAPPPADPSTCCGHQIADHSPAGYTCSRCNCGRLRFTRDVDNAIPATVLDCFSGMATTGIAARRLGRYYRGIELNPKYARSSGRRLERDAARRSFGGEKPKTEREAKAQLAQGNLFERSSRS